jgi:hypothetical protein
MFRSSFFDGVTHQPVAIGDTLLASAFYYRVASFEVGVTVSAAWARQVLDGTPLRPLSVAPGRAALVLGATSYQDSDAGPYDEVLMLIPVSLDRGRTPFGLLQWLRKGGGAYAWQVGVTTEIARQLGIEVLGWPKFLADIEVDVGSDPVSCSVSVDGRLVLELSARRPRCRPGDDRQRFDMFAVHDDLLLRCQAIDHIRESGFRVGRSDIRLTIGDHPIADGLREAGLGRPLGVSVVPQHEMVLTGVLEGWPVTT